MPAATFYQPIEKVLDGKCDYEYYIQTNDSYSKTGKSRICHVTLPNESEKNKDIVLMIFTIRNQPSAIKNPVWKIHSEGPKRMDQGATVPLRNTAVKIAKDKGWKYVAVAVAGEDTPETDIISKYIISMESYAYGNDTVYDLTADLEKLESLGEPDFYRSDANVNGTMYSLSYIKKEKFIEYLTLFDNRPYSHFETSTPNFEVLTPEWFKHKGEEFVPEDTEAAAMYVEFEERFGVEALNALSREDLLKSLFLGGNNDNLCHELEYVKRNTELFGSVKGGNAYKYPLFFDKESSTWISGTRYNPKQLTLEEAIIKGTAVRDGLVAGVGIITDSQPLESVEDYLNLYTKLYAAIPELVDSLWVIKYFHMMFPDLIPVFYNKDWQIRVLTALKIAPNDTAYGRLGQINEFVSECKISNVVFARVFHKYCRNIAVDDQEDVGVDEVVAERVKGGTNIILYGVPGAGKSWTIKHEYCDDESLMERLVFHPDYTYSDFVGQILPRIGDDGSVSYEFAPGPFTKLVRKAYINPDKMFYLVIEEVNRGNAPAIFGDIFQLLDRDKDGSSEYEITNADIAKIVYLNDGHKVSIPSNMSILCTMNTSDQNVFTLDTAFQRRWNMRLIKNKFHEDDADEKTFADTHILDTDVTWKHFFTEINKIILAKNIRMTSSEDKRLGTHFVAEEDLDFGTGDERQISRFPEKVLKYLWDDAFKFTKEDIFDLEKVKSLEDVIELFVRSSKNDRFKVFKENLYNTIVPKKEY